MPIVLEGIFGSTLASMQHQCDAWRMEDEAPCSLSTGALQNLSQF